MKALKITGVVQLVETKKDIRLVEHILGCAKGCVETIWTANADAVICIDREAQQHGKPRNDLASLIAGTGIYGTALIFGDGEDDVPARYIECLMQK